MRKSHHSSSSWTLPNSAARSCRVSTSRAAESSSSRSFTRENGLASSSPSSTATFEQRAEHAPELLPGGVLQPVVGQQVGLEAARVLVRDGSIGQAADDPLKSANSGPGFDPCPRRRLPVRLPQRHEAGQRVALRRLRAAPGRRLLGGARDDRPLRFKGPPVGLDQLMQSLHQRRDEANRHAAEVGFAVLADRRYEARRFPLCLEFRQIVVDRFQGIGARRWTRLPVAPRDLLGDDGVVHHPGAGRIRRTTGHHRVCKRRVRAQGRVRTGRTRGTPAPRLPPAAPAASPRSRARCPPARRGSAPRPPCDVVVRRLRQISRRPPNAG